MRPPLRIAGRRSAWPGWAALLALVAAPAGPARADAWSLDNDVQSRMESNDNYQLIAHPNGPVRQLQLSDTLSAARKTESQSTRIDMNVTAYALKGQDAGRNRVDGSLTVDQAYTDDRETYDLNLSYVRDTTFDNELGATGVVLTRGRRGSLNLGASWSHKLTERLNAGLQLSGSDVRYQHEVNGGVDYDYVTVAGTFGYLLSERTSVRLQPSHSEYRTGDGSTRSRTDSVTLNWVHLLSERDTVSAGVGAYRSDTVTPGLVLVCPLPALFCQLGLSGYVPAIRPVGFVNDGTQFSASWKGQADENTQVEVHASRAVVPSGASVLLQTDSASATVSRKLSETLSIDADYSESRSRYLGTQTPSQPRYWTAGIHLAKSLGEDLIFEAGYRHSVSDDIVTARSNVYFASLKYTWPRFAAAQ